MIGAFAFVLTRTLKNFVRWRLRRLRQPRYLAATLAGVVYIWLAWGRQMFLHHEHRSQAGMEAWLGRYHDVAELLAALGLTLTVAIAWALPQSGAALRFSAAEVQFLFPAPVSRRGLVHYKLLRSQLALILGVTISTLVLRGRMLYPELWPITFGMWLVLMMLNLHFTGIALLRTNLIEHGVSGARRSLVAIAVLVALGLAAILGTQDAVPVVRQAVGSGAQAVLEAAVRVSHQGLLAVVLAPARVMVRPALAPSLLEFARLVPAAFGILVLHYVWVMRSDAAFEEASAEASERRAAKLLRRRSGQRLAPVRLRAAHRPPFELRPSGRPEVAVVWKNLIAVGRFVEPRTLIRIAAFLVLGGVAATQMVSEHTPWRVVSGALAFFTGILFLFGASLFRADFRQDLAELETLKVWPLSGSTLVSAEVAVPALLLTALHWLALVALLVITPRAELGFLDAPTRAALLVSVMILAPAFDLVSVLIHNTAALLLPGWYAIGPARTAGVEAMGQRLLTMAGTLVCMLLLALPPALIGGLAYLLAKSFLGPWSFVLAALFAAVVYAGEAAFAIAALGRQYDRLDPSTEGILQS